MAGLSLVTKGFIQTVQVISGGGGGGAGLVPRSEAEPKPKIQVSEVTIKGENKVIITEDSFKVKSLKIVVDQKD